MKIIQSKATVKITQVAVLGEIDGKTFYKKKLEVVGLERPEPDTKFIVTPDVIIHLSSMLHPDIWAQDDEGNFYQM